VAGGLAGSPAFAQKSGGVLKVHHQDSPASMSIIEEATYSTVVPMMGVFNNLVTRQGEGEASHQPAQGLVPQSRRSDCRQ